MREILMCTGGVSQSACYERIQTAEMKLPTKICRPHKFVECTKIYKYPVGHLLTRLAATFANLVVTSTLSKFLLKHTCPFGRVIP